MLGKRLFNTPYTPMITLASKQTVGKNALWATAAEIISRFILFIAILQLADYLRATRFGELSYAFAIANICVMIVDFGLSTYVVQQVSRDSTQTKRYLSELLTLKLWLSGLTVGSMLVISMLVKNISIPIVLLGGGAIILNNTRMFLEAFFRAHHRLKLEAITKTTSAIVLASTLLYLVINHHSISTIAAGYFGAAAVGFIFTLVLLYKKITHFTLAATVPSWKTYLQAAWPFAISLGCNYLLNYFDSAMLGFFGYTQQLGWYTAAYKPIFFLTALAGMVVNAFFPAISEQYHHAKHKVPGTVTNLLRINSLIALPMVIGGTILAPMMMQLLYPNYPTTELTLIFRILLWSTGLIYLWAPYGNSLQACDRPKDYLRGFAWATVINVLLNIIVIPRWSIYGAAATTLLAQLFLFIYFRYTFQRHIAKLSLWKKTPV